MARYVHSAVVIEACRPLTEAQGFFEKKRQMEKNVSSI
jgi:hypothetical protein